SHALGGILQRVHVDALHLGIVAHAVDVFRHGRTDLHQVRVALFVDVHADRGLAVQLAREIHLLRTQGDVGDVAQLQAPRVDRHRTDVVQLAPLALRLYAPAQAAVGHFTGRQRKIRQLQPLVQLVESDAMRAQALGGEFDLYLRRGYAVDVHAGHAGDAFDRALQFAIEQGVGIGEVAVGCDAQR